jgi:hypothetical protein
MHRRDGRGWLIHGIINVKEGAGRHIFVLVGGMELRRNDENKKEAYLNSCPL